MEIKLVGPDAIDPLRTADFNVQPFQNRGHFADAPARIAAFECFVLRCLDQLQLHPGLERFGVSVRSEFSFEGEPDIFPLIVVTQRVTLIAEGSVRPLVNTAEFYQAVFPFSGVYQGEFALSADDARVKRYLEATKNRNHDDRRCVLALLSAEAERSFSAPALEIRPG